MMIRCLLFVLMFNSLLISCSQPRLVRSEAEHSAFGSLIRYNGRWYCAFREGSNHVDKSGETVGKLYVVRSRGGKHWHKVAGISYQDKDIRDASLVELPTGELAVFFGVSEYKEGKLISMSSHVSVMDKHGFSEPQKVNVDWNSSAYWLWKVTEHEGILYTVSYGGGEWRLLKSSDGLSFTTIKSFDLPFKPNEACIDFQDDKMIIVTRVNGEENGMIGVSVYPYIEWNWIDCGYRLGGPDICGSYVGSRYYSTEGIATAVFTLNDDFTLSPYKILQSSGDCSYPSMVRRGKKLYIAYYSSHIGKAAMFFTKVKTMR